MSSSSLTIWYSNTCGLCCLVSSNGSLYLWEGLYPGVRIRLAAERALAPVRNPGPRFARFNQLPEVEYFPLDPEHRAYESSRDVVHVPRNRDAL